MPQLTRPKLIVFDWDGTLCDSMQLIISSMQAAAKEQSIAVPDAASIRAITGLGLKEAMDRLFPGQTPQMQQQLIERYRYFYAHPKPGEGADLFAGAQALLQLLQKNDICCTIATGKSRKGLDASLAQTGVGHYFSYTRCADESCSKPDPQMLNETFSATGFSAQDTWMVGDSIYDLQMANTVAAQAIGVSYGAFTKTELEQYSPVCVDNIQQLQQLVLHSID